MVNRLTRSTTLKLGGRSAEKEEKGGTLARLASTTAGNQLVGANYVQSRAVGLLMRLEYPNAMNPADLSSRTGTQSI